MTLIESSENEATYDKSLLFLLLYTCRNKLPPPLTQMVVHGITNFLGWASNIFYKILFDLIVKCLIVWRAFLLKQFELLENETEKLNFEFQEVNAKTSHACKATPKTNIPMRAQYKKSPHEWGFNMLESKKRYTDS